MASITLELDLPAGVKIESYQRRDDAHALEVSWPLPETCTCGNCGHSGPARLEWKDEVRVVRDLDVWNQPCFWIYQVGYQRCQKCFRRQHLVPPFKRKETSYTYRFEEHVVRLLIGSTEEEVARRLGISAETVARIVQYQINEAKVIDPQRIITDIGMDELSLKKRHKLYATLMTDLTDPAQPRILAVAKGKDEQAGLACLDKLSAAQRAKVKTFRVDMGPAFGKACRARLKNAKAVVDRFHVAQKFNDVIDGERKKITHDYKQHLTPKERKEFRSLMWEFRRDPRKLTAKERARLEELFVRLPRLKTLYELKVRFKRIFDTAPHRQAAQRRLCELHLDALDAGIDLDSFFLTYERWQEEILNYFDAHQTSAAVEGINNKARVIIKRAYGLKSATSLWNRLALDLNLAKKALGRSIDRMRKLVHGLKAIFQPCCT